MPRKGTVYNVLALKISEPQLQNQHQQTKISDPLPFCIVSELPDNKSYFLSKITVPFSIKLQKMCILGMLKSNAKKELNL